MRRRVWRHGTVSAVGFGCDELRRLLWADQRSRIDAGAGARARARRRFLGHRQRLRRRACARRLIGKFLAEDPGRRSKVTLATKFAIRRRDDGARFFDNSAAHIREALEGSMKRLGVDHIDLYYVHRVDKAIPIEDTVGELARLVKAGVIGAIGLSRSRARHASARTRRASDRRRSVGIFALDAQSRARPHSGVRGSGRDSGRLLAARTRVSQRPSAGRRDVRRQGFPPRQSALPGRQLAAQPRPARRLSQARQDMGREAGDAGDRLDARQGAAHRADSRHPDRGPSRRMRRRRPTST